MANAKRVRTDVTVLGHSSLKAKVKGEDGKEKMQYIGATPYVHCTFDFTALWGKVFSADAAIKAKGQAAFEDLAMRELTLAINKAAGPVDAKEYNKFIKALPTGKHKARQSDKVETMLPELRIKVLSDGAKSIQALWTGLTEFIFTTTSRKLGNVEKTNKIAEQSTADELVTMIENLQKDLAKKKAAIVA